MKRVLSILHPWLAALFPLLFLYQRNINEIGPGEIVIPLLLVLASTGAILFLSNLVVRDWRRASLVTTATLLLFFSYGHVWQVFGGRTVGSVLIDKDLYLLLPYAAIAFGILSMAWSVRHSLKEITVVLNSIGLVLVSFPAISLATSGFGSDSARQGDCPPAIDAQPRDPGSARSRPDIYYLVFDRYPSQSTLKRRFGADNVAFIDYLRSKGFYVPEKTRANYPRTAHSLASSLNASFLDCLTKNVGANSSSYRPIFSVIQDNSVGRFLKRIGYRYYHYGSWAPMTATSSIADENFVYEASQGFANLLYSTTLARPFGEMMGLSEDRRHSNASRALFQFRKLTESRSLPGPRFIFAHILLPHDPYLFTKDGEFLTRAEESRRGLARNFTEQLAFTNIKIRELIDTLTAGPLATRPVIVIQSDEGPHPLRFDALGLDFNWDWTKATDDELADTLNIFNAIYLPDAADPGLYPTITPVNTFRKILNIYMDAKLPLLPDRTFIYRDEDHPYEFKDVTDRLPSPR